METITVRASSWGELFDCAHRWEAKNLLGIRGAPSLRAHLGTSIHAATAAYDKGGISVIDAGDFFLEAFHNPPESIASDADITAREASHIGVGLVASYCQEISPNYHYIGIEMETAPMEIECGGGVTIRLTGTMDRARIANFSAGCGIVDLKTGQRVVSKGVVKTSPHAAQIGVYELLYTHTSGIEITAPGEIVALSTSGSREIGVGTIHGARDILIGTEGQPGLMEYAAGMFRTGLMPPNPQSQMCGPKYCPRWNTCKFHY